MKKKNGFTLIELLAVIVILAIIALIATPTIINVIENSRKKAFENTAYGVLEGLRLDYVERSMNNNSSSIVEFDFPNNYLKLSGKKPEGGKAVIDKNGNISFALFDGDKKWCAKKDANSETVNLSDYEEDSCNLEESPKRSFENDSWDVIASVVKENPKAYEVGAEKEVMLTGEYEGSYTVRVANNSFTPECLDDNFSKTTCGFVVEFKDIIAKAKMNIKNSEDLYERNEGGWPASEMYSIVNNNIYNSLPEDLKKNIIDTTVISSHGAAETNNFKSIDKLYLLSTKEVWGKNEDTDQIKYDTSDNNTKQLEYYKNIGVTTNNYSGVIKQYNSINDLWWLRSASSKDNNAFYIAKSDGKFSDYTASNSHGIAPAFRIG